MGRLSLLVALAAVTLATTAGAGPRPTVTLRVSVVTGGVVTSGDGRIRCRSRCSASYPSGAIRKLTATPSRSYLFVRWEGDCIGTAPICVVALDRRTTVRAVFVGRLSSVWVSSSGPGMIVSTPAGISCGGGGDICDFTVPHGTLLTLSQKPTADGRFHTWDGPCAGAPADCTLRVESTVETAAAFEHVSPGSGLQPLTVTLQGSPVHVTSHPSGIDCSPTCSTFFPSRTFLVLDFDAAYGGSWSGACHGRLSHCNLILDAETEVVALGRPPPPPALPPRARAQVDVTVSGLGLVASPTHSIECGRTRLTCTTVISGAQNQNVALLTLRSSPGRHFRLARWYGGACRGKKATCHLRSPVDTQNPPKNNVAALFRLKR